MATRLDPSASSLFDGYAKLITAARASQKVGSDLVEESSLQRLEALLPFQSLDELKDRGNQLDLLRKQSLKSDSYPASDDFTNIQSIKIALDHATAILDQKPANGSTELQLVETIMAKSDSDICEIELEESWTGSANPQSVEQIKSIRTYLKTVRHLRNVLALSRHLAQYQHWNERIAKIGIPVDSKELSAEKSLGRWSGQYREAIQEGGRLYSEIQPLLIEEKIPEEAKLLLDSLESKLTGCERAMDWSYNMEALARLKLIANSDTKRSDAADFRMKLLARIERNRLNPLVYSRYEQELNFVINSLLKGDLNQASINAMGKMAAEQTIEP